MDGYVVHAVEMERGSSLRIDDGTGMLVQVREGGLWITQAGDSRDHFCGPGGRFRVERDGATVVHACRSSHVSLAAPMPSNYARRIALTPAGAAAPRVLYDAAGRGDWLTSLRYRFRFLGKRPVPGPSPRG